MRFQTRLILFSTASLVAVVFVTALVLAWNARHTMLETAESEGRLVALILARSAGVAEQVPREVEQLLGEHMVAEATLTAHFVAAAEAARFSPAEINRRLQEIAAQSVLDEFWITDQRGHAYLRNLTQVDFTFDPDPHRQPQASAFWPLLSGKSGEVIQEARRREIDNHIYKYVGVSGVDKPRIVEVGLNAHRLETIRRRMGIDFMVKNLLAGGAVNAIWVLSPSLQTVAFGSVFGTEVNPEPSPREMGELRKVFQSGESLSLLDQEQMTVMAPIPGPEGGPVGVALVRLPLDRVRQTMREQAEMAVAVAFGTLFVGILLATLMASRVTRPLLRITAAAREVEAGSFSPEMLEKVGRRNDEVGHLAQVFGTMAREVFARQEQLDGLVRERTRELEEKNHQLSAAHRQIQEELQVARALQLAILPTEFPSTPEWDLFGLTLPAREMGGDFYDIFQIDEDRLGLLVADVSGKGVPAAFFMAVSRTKLQAAALEGAPPGEVLAAVNTALCRENPLELFVTVFYGILDRRDGTFRYASGGHNPPLLCHGEAITPLPQTGGLVLGQFADIPYADNEITLAPGDTLFLYTDGISEAMDRGERLFGVERLAGTLRHHRHLDARRLVEQVVAAVEAFAGEAEQSDDITCLALCHGGDVLIREFRLANDIQELPRLAAEVEAFGAEAGLPAKVIGRLTLVLDELATNTLSYGFEGTKQHLLRVTLRLAGERLEAELVDDGKPFNPLEIPPPDVESDLGMREVGGLGIHFVRELMDEVEYRHEAGCNHLTLVTYIGENRT